MKTIIQMSLLSAGVLLATGCRAQAVQSTTTPPPANAVPKIMLDGDTDDWDQLPDGYADGHFIYLHFSPVHEFQPSIQAAPYTTRIRIDADESTKTGRPMQWMSIEASMQEPQGVDLLVELSPKNAKGTIGIGSSVTRYTQAGKAISLGHSDIGFAFLPTYGSNDYEARIDRHAPRASMLPDEGPIEVVVDQIDENGRFLWSTTIRVVLPKLAPIAQTDATIPAKPSQSVRVMSANVLFSSPLESPDAFARVLGAIEPDVILYQEWFNTPVEEVSKWLNTYAGSGWSVHMPNAKAGVAIATKNRIIQSYEAVIPPSGNERPARAVAALIDTDAGELLAISVHLKCCGNAESEEDHKRIKQAKAINAFVRSVHKKHPKAKVVIAGDFNLVGSRVPLETMSRALGIHGEDLSVVNTVHIGDASMITWNDEKSRFSPGRLDWMLIDESVSQAANAFILDTRALSPEALTAMGLEGDDSKASDHLPIVMDLIDAE
jgi:endonuclease/exonuclease/phosphatase family metal-dependent hydrolase